MRGTRSGPAASDAVVGGAHRLRPAAAATTKPFVTEYRLAFRDPSPFLRKGGSAPLPGGSARRQQQQPGHQQTQQNRGRPRSAAPRRPAVTAVVGLAGSSTAAAATAMPPAAA
ncbi:hypothetical protein HK405_013819, partial [Cladochytrium tenue]